jgi:O-antigen/teichoic acid export membrane protein
VNSTTVDSLRCTPLPENGKKATVFLHAIPGSVRRIGWTTTSYGIVQSLRLVTNVVLARLLTPELFGIMLIVNTARTGIELLSDIGIGQNVVKSRRADEKDFLDTAWTLQVVRGFLLAVVALTLAYPLGAFYELPLLPAVVAVSALNFIALGCSSVHGFVLKRRLDLSRFSYFEVVTAAITALIHVVFVYISPTIWSLVWAGVVSGAITAAISHNLIPGLKHRLVMVREHAVEIFGFGRWVFIASVLYFVASNFDRMYLAGAVPVAVLGIYGIAKSLTDMISVLVVRLGDFVIFPTVAASKLNRSELRAKLRQVRPKFLMAAVVAVAGFTACSDTLVGWLYDDRYSLAALILPVMAAGTWFGILSTASEAVLLGVGRPSYAAGANAIKLTFLIVAVPAIFLTLGLAAAIIAFAAAEFARYLVLAWAQSQEGLLFVAQDITMTVALMVLVTALRATMELLGIGTGAEALWFGNGTWELLNSSSLTQP